MMKHYCRCLNGGGLWSFINVRRAARANSLGETDVILDHGGKIERPWNLSLTLELHIYIYIYE